MMLIQNGRPLEKFQIGKWPRRIRNERQPRKVKNVRRSQRINWTEGKSETDRS